MCLFDFRNPNPKSPVVTTTKTSLTTPNITDFFKVVWEKNSPFLFNSTLTFLLSTGNIVVGVGWGTVYLIDKNNGILINEIKYNETGCAGSPSQKLTVDVNGNYLVIGCDKIIYAISLEGKGELLWSQVLSDIVNSVSTNGEKIVAGCADGRVHVLSKDGSLSFSKFFGRDPVVDVEIADASSYAAIGTINGKLYLMDINNGKVVWQYELEYPVGDLTVSPAGDVIVVGSVDDNVYFFENGNLAWKSYVGGDVCKVLYSPKYGTVFAGTCEDRKDNSVTAINSKGLVVSQIIFTGLQVLSADTDANLVIAGDRYHSTLYFFDSSGNFLGKYKLDGQLGGLRQGDLIMDLGLDNLVLTEDGDLVAYLFWV